jgi:hypothetical protein
MALAPVAIGGKSRFKIVWNALEIIVEKACLNLRRDAVPEAIDILRKIGCGCGRAAKIVFAERAGKWFDIAGEGGIGVRF